MLEDLSKTLADVALAGIGLTVIAVEKTSELVKVCADRGGEFLEKSKVAGEEWRVKAEQKAAEGRERVKQEYIEHMTDEERADLMRRLAELDARKAEEAKVAEEVSKVIDFDPEHRDEE
jgi:polyhydroxyalkanoate synthesis regulator phasin